MQVYFKCKYVPVCYEITFEKLLLNVYKVHFSQIGATFDCGSSPGCQMGEGLLIFASTTQR